MSRYNEHPGSPEPKRVVYNTDDKRWLKALGIADPDKLAVPVLTTGDGTVLGEVTSVTITKAKYICEDCKFKSCDCAPPSTDSCGEYRVNCPCWSTGRYVWTAGCIHHPWESMT